VLSPAFSEDKAEKMTPKMEAKEGMTTGDHVMMKDGKMMMMKDGKSMMMDKDIMVKNGSKVMVDGTVMAKDGSKMMIKDGDIMDMNGMIVKPGMMKPSKK
jgi:uncharacterized Zn ribbon protein